MIINNYATYECARGARAEKMSLSHSKMGVNSKVIEIESLHEEGKK